MGAFWSSAVSSSTQVANTNITQQYSGTCKISCNNTMNNVDATAVNSNVDGIYVTQSCAVNGQCMMNSTANALADVVLKAQNAASQALSWLPSSTTTLSYQEINENIQQYVNQTCKITSSNEMNNVNVYAVNSNIANGIHIGQTGTVKGSCALSNLMSATAKATEMADNCAASGKSAKKKACSGKGGGIGSLILYGIIGIVLFTAVMMVIKYMKGGLPDCTDDLIAKKTPCKLGQTPLKSLPLPSGTGRKTPTATPYGNTSSPTDPYYPQQSVELATEAPRISSAPREVYAEPLPGPYDEPLYDTPVGSGE